MHTPYTDLAGNLLDPEDPPYDPNDPYFNIGADFTAFLNNAAVPTEPPPFATPPDLGFPVVSEPEGTRQSPRERMPPSVGPAQPPNPDYPAQEPEITEPAPTIFDRQPVSLTPPSPEAVLPAPLGAAPVALPPPPPPPTFKPAHGRLDTGPTFTPRQTLAPIPARPVEPTPTAAGPSTAIPAFSPPEPRELTEPSQDLRLPTAAPSRPSIPKMPPFSPEPRKASQFAELGKGTMMGQAGGLLGGGLGVPGKIEGADDDNLLPLLIQMLLSQA